MCCLAKTAQENPADQNTDRRVFQGFGEIKIDGQAVDFISPQQA
jgi:hypothetical protein